MVTGLASLRARSACGLPALAPFDRITAHFRKSVEEVIFFRNNKQTTNMTDTTKGKKRKWIKMDQNGSDGSEGGNNCPPSDQPKKRSPLGEKWLFVHNNYSPENLDQWIKILSESDWPSGFSQEVGKECGTPHLQGFIDFSGGQGKRVRPIEMRAFKALTKTEGFNHYVNWGDDKGKPCRGSNADNVRYFCKDDNPNIYLFNGLRKPREVKFPTFDKWWQKEILELIQNEPDDRTIHWFWSTEGGVGKSTFCKFLVLKEDALILSGKGADVRNGVLTYKQDRGDFPHLCVYNIPRTFNTQYINPESLENVKDMLFYSGKYEGGSVAGPCPHLIVFANFSPRKFGLDWDEEFLKRVVVKNIDE